jgi:tRNA nucleotidyltransferase (CCA-adding enzyme)
MAVSLNPADYGDLYDPFHGLKDLQNRAIRVLHEKSFIDDPTRMWRAVRYEQRLDFKIEPLTLDLFKRDLHCIRTVSGDRVRNELELVLREEFPEKALKRASELGLLAEIHPDLIADERLEVLFEEIRENRFPETPLTTVYLAVLLYDLSCQHVEAIAKYLHLSRTVKRTILETQDLKTGLSRFDKEGLSPADVYFFLKDYSLPAIFTCMVACDTPLVKSHLQDYLYHYRHVGISLNGDDLKRLGVKEGPAIKEVMNILLEKRLNGVINSAQDEIGLVKEWLAGHNRDNKEE